MTDDCGATALHYAAINSRLEIMQWLVTEVPAASEPSGNDLTVFNDFSLKAKARIWYGLSYICRIHWTAAPINPLSQAQQLPCRGDPRQGNLAHKKQPPAQDHHRALGIGLL